ncbi:tRNA 2-selenouridine(34) synthase MnmH [Caminicella sporogenes]|uniref:tRNA 2-selenouridine(34) synthase MnmH n=1 Tax=Caminicella sporogenes TaxID=166485 RepID=UPI00253F9E8D|nr:tRNA 2-selenouridine(34) synthase MnmH [Caminicella sporogenes]WIF94694.1 tRNA 2-selenouridine(34) synthase MnmH [Caminicella sporogenes]
MVNKISIEAALNLSNSIFIDVRSPKEFKQATISNSINIPILDDDEKILIGNIYRNKSIEEAKSLGLRFASSKLESIYRQILEIKKKYKNIIIFCWRGGTRSKSVCNVLNVLGVDNVYQLEGGYKAYRRYVIDFIETKTKNIKFVVLHGLTGVGKTHILEHLERLNYPVIDFEYIAKNSGSVFGNILFPDNPPTQKNFESIVFNKLYYNKSGYVLVESESKRVGNINIPDEILKAMNNGYHILINTNIENRIDNIYNDYIKNKEKVDEKIIEAILNLKKRLGSESVEKLVNKIKIKDYRYVIRYLINNYYDSFYKYSINKFKNYDLEVNYESILDAVKEVEIFILKTFQGKREEIKQ